MRYIFIGAAGVLTAFALAFIMADDVEYVGAAPTAVTYQKSLLPLTDSTYEIGTSTNAWLRGNFDELCLTGSSCISSWLAGGGGGGGTTLYVQNGGATLNTATTTLNFTSNSFSLTESPTDTFIIRVATTTLGLLTTNVAEGTNLYYTDARVSQYMSASSTYSNLISFYTTPSSVITAGTGIDWSGNTLNGVYTAGDALTLTGEDFDFDGGTAPAGALGGTWASPTVDDDGHNHTSATLSGIDISADTNLTVTATGLELSGDAIALAAGYTIPTTTRAGLWDTAYSWGNHATQGYLTGITGQSIEDLSDVTTFTQAGQDLFYYNGSAWDRLAKGANGEVLQTNSSGNLDWVATSTLGLGGAGGGTVTSVDMTVPTGLTVSGNPVTTSGTLAVALGAGYNIPLTASTTNWNTAYNWGNHASQGYITDGNTGWDNSYGYVTQGQTVGTTTAGVAGQASYWTGTRTLGTVATGTLTESVLGLELDNSTRGLFGGSAALSLTSGYFVPTTTRAATWDLANSWGNHATAGYDQVTTAGDGLTRTVNDFDCDTASGTVFGCLSAANWTTFNNKQDTITAGDALTLTGTDIDFDGGATPSGDLGGTWASPSVTDDSHAHTGTTISGIDISADTNLTADGTEIVLTGDALSLGTALTFTTGTSTTAFFSGIGTFTNAFVNTLLTAAAATFTGLVDIGAGILEIPNGTGSTSDDPGEISHDTTDNQLILDDYVIRTKEEIYKFSIASTSPYFVSGVTKKFPVIEDGYVVSDVYCMTESGTSKAITIYGESITCDSDGQADDGTISIATIGAASTTIGVTMGATTGTVDAVNITVTGRFTRE